VLNAQSRGSGVAAEGRGSAGSVLSAPRGFLTPITTGSPVPAHRNSLVDNNALTGYPVGPMEHVQVPVSGGRAMHVTILGPAGGPATVALHGLGGSTQQNLPALVAIAEHYGLRIYAIDLPNHGRSARVGLFDFRVRHFSALIGEAVQGLGIEPVVIFGHSFGGQLAALLAERMSADSVQPIFVNPALGVSWDRKLRLCWRQPWRFFKLVEELGYNEGNIARSELYHAGMLMRSIVDMFLDRDLRPFRRFQATMALLTNLDTASILGRLTERGIVPVTVHGAADRSTPAGSGVHFVDGFHSWLQEASGPEALLVALNKVFPGPLVS
jgi:pimeloyl-ACP methyl ester carboxylesterase